MKILNIEQRTPEWYEARKGSIRGSNVKDIMGTPYMRKQTFYKILAERLSVGEYDEETALARGVRLEDEACDAYREESGYEVENVGFTFREDNKFMGESPDGLIKENGKYTGAVEIKCLGSHNHVKAKLEGKIPEEYEAQVMQKFVVNDDLRWVDFVMYDPRIVSFPYLKFRIERDEDSVIAFRQKEEEFLNEVEEALAKLIDF